MPLQDQFSRQRKLAEIGDAGQARLTATEYQPEMILDEPARLIALRYAVGCGLRQSTGRTEPAQELPVNTRDLVAFFRHPAPASIARGASSVLSSVLRALALPNAHLGNTAP